MFRAGSRRLCPDVTGRRRRGVRAAGYRHRRGTWGRGRPLNWSRRERSRGDPGQRADEGEEATAPLRSVTAAALGVRGTQLRALNDAHQPSAFTE